MLVQTSSGVASMDSYKGKGNGGVGKGDAKDKGEMVPSKGTGDICSRRIRSPKTCHMLANLKRSFRETILIIESNVCRVFESVHLEMSMEHIEGFLGGVCVWGRLNNIWFRKPKLGGRTFR